MEKSFIESVPTNELYKIAQETATAEGGDYTAARNLVNEELSRRTRIIEAQQAVQDAYLVPEDPQVNLNCESCE